MYVILAHRNIANLVQAAHTDKQVVSCKMEVKWSIGLNRASQRPRSSSRYTGLFNEATHTKTTEVTSKSIFKLIDLFFCKLNDSKRRKKRERGYF